MYDFNSIKVRLKRLWNGTDENYSMKFQFHKGTIKTFGEYILFLSKYVISIP